jgi:hypothetical protein
MARIKRCIISPDRFRVSNPGADVSSDDPSDFMLHEDLLAAQPYFFGYVACPFAGYSGTDSKLATVDVTVPDVDATPTIVLFPNTNANLNTYPFPRDSGSGTDQTGYDVEHWDIAAQALSSTQIRVAFTKDSDGRKSPKGCYLALVRKS